MESRRRTWATAPPRQKHSRSARYSRFGVYWHLAKHAGAKSVQSVFSRHMSSQKQNRFAAAGKEGGSLELEPRQGTDMLYRTEAVIPCENTIISRSLSCLGRILRVSDDACRPRPGSEGPSSLISPCIQRQARRWPAPIGGRGLEEAPRTTPALGHARLWRRIVGLSTAGWMQ